MKEEILKLKKEHPEYGYKKIAKILNCSPNNVKYHLNPSIKKQHHSRQTLNREIQMHSLRNSLGGRCQICGYNKCFDALAFHHIKPQEKEEQVPVILRSYGFARAKEEAKKCALLCHNCHTEVHSGITKLESTTGAAPVN